VAPLVRVLTGRDPLPAWGLPEEVRVPLEAVLTGREDPPEPRTGAAVPLVRVRTPGAAAPAADPPLAPLERVRARMPEPTAPAGSPVPGEDARPPAAG